MPRRPFAIGRVAICAAVSRPGIHAVSIGNAKQQSLQSVHRMRERRIHERTAKSKQIKSMVAEEGFIFPMDLIQIKQAIVALVYSSDVPITLLLRRPGSMYLEQLTALQQWSTNLISRLRKYSNATKVVNDSH